MAGNKFSMDDYIDVAERIVHFKEKHPEGSLQTIGWTVQEVAGRTFIVYHAAAYRTPDDERPGHGIAWEPFPGPTPYTKDSELMNAETAAWGRAIVAVGLAANRKIASKQEVQARSGNGTGNGSAAPTPPTLDNESVREVAAAITAAKMGTEWVRSQLIAVGAQHVPDGQVTQSTIAALTPPQAAQLVALCAQAREQREAATA